MSKVSIVLLTCALVLLAEKRNLDWQSGRIIETSTEQKTIAWGSRLNQKTALVDREVYSVETPDKSYLVSGPVSGRRSVPVAGMEVSFAVEGRTMFILLSGKEHHFHIERVSAAPQAGALPKLDTTLTPPSTKPTEPTASELDNDAIVKMIIAELNPHTIVQIIEKRPGRYIVAPEAVAGLKAAGVPEIVVSAMSEKMNAHQ